MLECFDGLSLSRTLTQDLAELTMQALVIKWQYPVPMDREILEANAFQITKIC